MNVKRKTIGSKAAKPYASGSEARDGQRLVFYAAVFKNCDLVGDIIDPGAFDKWLASFNAQSKSLPICWSHDWSVKSIIGSAKPGNVVADAHGLLVSADLMDTDDARQVWNLANADVAMEASFAYDIQREATKSDGNHLQELTVIEAGPTLKGANPLAGDVLAKSLTSRPDLKAIAREWREFIAAGEDKDPTLSALASFEATLIRETIKAAASPQCHRCGAFLAASAHSCRTCGSAVITTI